MPSSIRVCVLGLALVLVGGVACTGGAACECVPCSSAVTVVVVDTDGDPVDDWTLEATVDGRRVDDFDACDPGARDGNQCSFGVERGVYHIIVRAPGYATREMNVRFAAESGTDCCLCVQGEAATVVLERDP
jgi:hypothetical protein